MADDDRLVEDDREAVLPDDAARVEAGGATEETVARGKASGTPFVLLGGIALVIWTVVGVVAAGLLLLWWLG